MFEKTMRMPKEMLRKWLAGLRSGEFKQAHGKLEKNGNYCCLGVLQKVIDGKVECFEHGSALGTPTAGWCTANNVEHLTLSKYGRWALPSLVDFAGRPMTAWEANDDGGRSFAEIADALEKHVEVY